MLIYHPGTGTVIFGGDEVLLVDVDALAAHMGTDATTAGDLLSDEDHDAQASAAAVGKKFTV